MVVLVTRVMLLASVLPIITVLTLENARPCMELRYLRKHEFMPQVGTITETPGTDLLPREYRPVTPTSDDSHTPNCYKKRDVPVRYGYLIRYNSLHQSHSR